MESWTKEVVFSDKFVPRPQWGAREPNGITSFRFSRFCWDLFISVEDYMLFKKFFNAWKINIFQHSCKPWSYRPSYCRKPMLFLQWVCFECARYTGHYLVLRKWSDILFRTIIWIVLDGATLATIFWLVRMVTFMKVADFTVRDQVLHIILTLISKFSDPL